MNKFHEFDYYLKPIKIKKVLLVFLILILSNNLNFSQSLENKNILVVWGGWKGHQPKVFADNVIKWLKSQNAKITESNNLEVYDNYDSLTKFDLIIQSVTLSDISNNQADNLVKAINNGVGIAGAHGGLTDSFRTKTNYQFMIGGQFVAHPGGKVNFEVNMLNDQLTQGLNNIEIFTEQYYMHFDPNIEIIANTIFDNKFYPWIDGVIMPFAWKKKYGKGKVFYISIGHDPNEFIRYPDGWKLLTRGFIWACRN